MKRRFDFLIILAVMASLVTLAGCCAQPQQAPVAEAPAKEAGLMVSFSGGAALMSTDGGSEVEILGSSEQALEAGVSQELVEEIFAVTAECSIKLDDQYFWCKKPRTCTGDCVIYSSFPDGSYKRVEEADEDGKVPYERPRLYWCPCE